MSHRIVKRIYRFSAWILIQALLVSPSSAWALRAQTSEGAAKSGLEERLMAPTLVAQISKKGVQIARRSVGVPVGSGVWSPKAGSPAEELVLSSNPSADISQSIDHLLKPGTALLHDMVSVPVVRDVFEALSAGREKMPVVFLSNSGSMLNWRVTDREGQVGVDVTVPAELYQPDYAGGLAVLGGLLLHHAAARAAGYSPRRAYHATIAFYESLSNDQQKQLDKLLDTPWMDHGNTFRTFLHRATDSKEAGTDLEPFRGVESQVLEEQAKTESKPDVRARMLEAVHYRDRQVSWLMGQIRIDLPYDRAKFVAAARNADLTLDQRREGTAAIMANYDRDVEVENARRVAADVRESLPDGYPLPLLVAGRFSRAFGNQANLFADSSYVPRTEPVVQAISALDRAVQAEELLKQLEGHPLQSSLRTQLVRVHPAVARLRLLAFGPDPAAPMTQYRGAARQVREALTVVRTRVNASLQRWRQIELDAAREGIGRRADARDVDQIEAKAAEFQSAFARLAGEGGEIDRAMTQLEGALAQAQTVSAAFSVLMQRPSPTGSINLAEVNELEPKPEQEPALQKLVRLGGHNTYGSPDLAWVGEATDVIEAAPLSIYERLVEVDGRHITVFEVDQEGLEQTIRSMADHWARNIDQSMDSEHAALARRYVVEADPSLAEQARRYRESGATEEGANLRVIREAGDVVQQRTAQVAAWAAREFDRKIEAVEARVESRWKEKDFIDRMEALRQILPPPADVLKAARRAGKSLAAETQRLTPAVLLPRRERPAFHMLTTEAPGLVEGFIQVVLEEEMALRNVLLGEGKKKGVDYEAEVKERTDGYRVRITALAEQVVKEFGYGVMVENLQRQGLSRDRALQKVIGDNITLRDELVAIAVLAEAQEAEQKARKKKYTFDAAHPDHPLVDTILGSEQRRVLQKQAEEQVMENNRFDPVVMNKTGTVSETIEGAAHLSQERDQRIRSLARREALARLSRQHPDWRLEQRARSWYRQHTALAQTNARREVIAAHHLQARMMDPRHYYGSGATYQRADGKFVASGRRKRYDLIYAPSRVNLGKGERESVEVYPQWVGVTDPLSARRAYRVYSLINENVQVRLIKEAETLKVSENERTALIRAVANTQSFFTQSLQYGDAEDLWYQFDLRGGLPVVAVKQGESFQPGPTTGYCIPKDPLFKLFRHALTDEVKLTQIGIPAHLQPVLIQMVAEMEERRSDFDSEGEFEQWVMQELLSQQGLRRRFKPAEADAVLASLNPYLSVTGGILLFHLTKLHEILGNLGRPSLLASQGHDLGLFLWSAWAGEKVTLGGEQVNRATLHQITSDVFHLRDEAEKLNPRAAVVPENQMRVHGYGPYKGDPDHPSPPDVRDSAGGRLFMDLSDMGKYVSHSLDAKGQAIWRANRYGLRLDSDEPDDLRVAQLLAQEFLGLTDADVRQSPWYERAWGRLRAEQLKPQEFSNREGELLLRGYVELLRGLRTNSDPRIAALQEQFPGHGTVGDITITVVPGVSTGDFMGFKVDAKTAMEETADDVQAQLTALGISVDQMRANAQLRRPLDKWVPLVDLPAEQRQAAVAEIGGRVHPLALRLRGPGTDFQQDLQGQDVVVFLTVHPDLLELNPAQIRDLMLVGRPNSALGIRDGSVQGRHRVWFDRDVMFWYAAGRGVDQEGRIITDWSRRDAEGRNSVYATFGVGGQSWKPLLGTDLREEAIRQERRAVRLYSALQKVADTSDGDLRAAVQAANEVYRKDLNQRQMALEAQWAAEYLQMTQGKGVDKPRDEVVRSRLQQLAEGLPLDRFTSVHWLSIGGMFLLNGAPDEQQKQVLETLTRAQQRMSGLEESIPADVRLLIVPQMKPAAMQAGERRGQMFSVKASEEQAVRAVARLAALQAEAVRQGVLAQREKGFRTAAEQADTDPLAAGRQRLQELTEAVQSGADSDALHEKAGQVIGRSVQVLRALNDELLSGDARQHDRVEAQIRGLTNGRELDPRAIKKFTGTYEDPGIFALWFEQAGDSGREKVASAVELFTAALALEKVAPFLGQPAEQVNEGQFWRATAEFFAETLDDHFHEYNPWAYDPKRGSGFSSFYDDLGVLRPERAEELYGLAWRHNRQLYAFLRELMITRTSLSRMPQADRDRLLGRVTLGVASEQDEVTVEAIGAGAAAPEELKWRAYNQLREMAFLRNDGFQWPVVFENFDPNDPETLDAAHRVNFTFMAPVGRTHYSRALMEASALGENVFITRNGRMATPPGASGPVLQIQNAHFWLSEPQYRQALIQSKGMNAADADRQIAEDRKSGRLTPKGIRVAAGFKDPVTVGSVVAFHHHPLVPQLEAAGYPYTDKDGVHYDITYDKSLYPQAFNPPHQTGVLLPAEIDWHHEETVRAGSREAAVPAIRDWLRPFAQQYGTLVAKGSAESGARNFQRFDLLDSKGQVDEERLTAAAEFIYEVSKGQNVTVQRMVLTTPIAWMDPAAVQEFVNRQVRDWGVAVNLETHPKSWVYGTVRVILSSGMPDSREPTDSGLFNPANWHVAHRISLNSLQAATNVGRQGTLEKLTPEMVRPEFREQFIPELEDAGRRVMVALARYGKKYWDEVYVPQYQREHGGQAPVEFDASGVPYWWPRYMMLDIIPEPVWGHEGREVADARVIDVIPGDPARGTPSRFILRTPAGQEFDGEILGFRFWLLEPNVGIGLWPNYSRRELVHEQARAKQEGRTDLDWSRVGEGDRVVLNDYIAAGEAFLRARLGEDHFGPEGPHRRPAVVQTGPDVSTPAAPGSESADPFQQALTAVRGAGVGSIGPAEASLVLVEAGLRSLGGRDVLAGQDPAGILQQANEWLDPAATASRFPQGTGISVSGEQVAQWLGDPDYRSRVSELILDRVLSHPLAPPVAVVPGRMNAAEVRALLPESATFAVVTGKRALMTHHLYPWSVSQPGSGFNVVGVHADWFSSRGQAKRFLVLDEKNGYFREVTPEEPVALTHALITELPIVGRDGETQLHRKLEGQLGDAGVVTVNPYGTVLFMADNKGKLRQSNWMTEGDLPRPKTLLPDMEISPRLPEAAVERLAGESPDGVVIQPIEYGTEGRDVAWFASDDLAGQMRYIRELEAQDQLVMASSFRGNVFYNGRVVVFRFNVVSGRVVSVSAVAAPPGEKIASLGRGGETIPLAQVLNNLQGLDGGPVRITSENWERLEQLALQAAEKSELEVVGLDLLLERGGRGPDDVSGLVLEANGRPGTLIFGEQADFPVDGSVQTRPAGAAHTDFWRRLSLRGHGGASVRQVVLVHSDPAIRAHAMELLRSRHPWLNVMAFATPGEALSYFSGIVDAGKGLPYSPRSFPNLVVLGGHQDGLSGAPARRLQGLLSDHHVHYTTHWGWDDQWLLKEISYARDIQETFTLSEWRSMLANPEGSGLREMIARFVPADRLDEELSRIRRLVEQAVTRQVSTAGASEPLFLPEDRVALSFAPGRVRFFMGHSDIRGSGGQTINAATHLGTWALTQVREEGTGRVVADNLDPAYPPFEFRLDDPSALPPLGISKIRPDWLAWAEANGDPSKWDSLTRGVFAFIRTEAMDPGSTQAEADPMRESRRKAMNGMDVRILVSESNLPTGLGMASSSALPALLIRGFQMFLPWEWRLNDQRLNDMDYVAYMAGDRAGTADMTAINTGQLGQVSVLYSYPERQGSAISLPKDFRFLVVDLGGKRLDDPSQPPDQKNLAAHIKSMTGMGPSLASVWLRHVARTDSSLGFLENVLMAEPTGHPFGLLRELTDIGELAKPQYDAQVNGEGGESRWEFAHRLLDRIPNDLTLGQLRAKLSDPDLQARLDDLTAGFTPLGAHKIPAGSDPDGKQLAALRMGSVIPLRQMASYIIWEIRRGVAYEHAETAKEIIHLMRRAQDGDRAAWTLGVDGQLVPTPWGTTGPDEAFFRSLPDVDGTIDDIQRQIDAKHGEDSIALRVMAAGLGSGVAVGVTQEAYADAVDLLKQRGYRVLEIQPGGGATSISMRAPAAAANAGLEEADSEASADVIDGTTTLVENKPPDTTSSSPYRGDVASSVLALAHRIFHRRDDSQIAFVAVYNEAGLQGPFAFELSDPIESVKRLAQDKGIPLAELRVALDVNPSAVNTTDLPNKLQEIGVKRANIIAFPQIQDAINVALNNDPARRLHERSPWFTKSFDLLIGVTGATEVSGWANAIAQIPGTQVQAAFFPGKARGAVDFDALWKMRLTTQRSVTGQRKTVFDLQDLADSSDHKKMYATTLSTGYMNIPGIEYGPQGITAYTMIFQEGENPVVLVDHFSYVNSREDALEQSVAILPGFQDTYPGIYAAMKKHGPAAAHPVTRQVVDPEAEFLEGEADKSNWPDGFLGLRLVSSRAYDLAGHPARPPVQIRGNGHRDSLASALASGWMRGIALHPGIDSKTAGKAADRLARDAMGIKMDQDGHLKRIVAFEGARDGSASWEFGKVLGKEPASGLEEGFILQPAASEIQQWVGSLDQSSEVSQELYGWIRDIPAEEQKEVLRVVSAAYLSFGDLMRWTSQYVVENRYRGTDKQKSDSSWVTEQDEFVQQASNQRVRDLTRQLDVPIAGIGEEGDVKTSGARWHLIRDPIDGTNAYRKPRTEKGSGHYLSTLTLLYTDSSERVHPVLTMVIAPEYPYPADSRFSSVQGLWMTAGLGIDGVWLNGEPIAPVQESVSLENAVAAVRVSRHRSATVDEVYREILKAKSKRVADYDNDMALFEFPLSVAEPGLYPQLYLVDHPNLIWDALPPRHLAVALGVQVTALNRNSLQLTSRLLQRQGRTVPPQVFGLPGAQQQFIRLYQQRRATAGGLEEMPPSPVKNWVLHPTGIPGYQRLLYTLEDGSPWLGGVVKDDVPSDAIAQTAYVAPYSTVEGKNARLGSNAQVTAGSAVIGSAVSANAQILGSVAEQALIHPWAQVSDSTLGPAFDTDSWSYSTRTEGDPELSVRNHSVSSAGGTYQVELGVRTFTTGSVVQDSFVGDDSRVLGSAVVISRWGPNTLLDGGVKSLLTVAARGHANVAGVQHRPDGSEVPAALEVAEAAFMGLPEDQHSGTQIHERTVGYTEAVVANSIPLASYDGNELKVESYAVPPLTLNGDYSIFSIFAGSPSPQSVKTDGRPTPGVITRLTGGPGEQISQHGRIVVDPFAMVPAFSNVIGRLLGFPELNDPAGLLREPEVTHLGALSTVGVDAQLGLRGLEAWGRLFPGEARGQLGRASGIAPWVFLYAPEAVFALMGRLAEALPAAEQSRYDDLPQRLLRSGQALSRWMLDQEKAKGSEANAQVVARLNRYVAGYTALIESNAWTGGWVQEGSLRHPAHWHRLHGRWESEFLDLDQAHHVVHPLADSVPYAQVSMNQLLALPPGIERPDWNRWTPYYLKDEDLRTDPPTPLDQLQPVPDDLKTWRIIGQDDHFYYTVEGGRIGREVNLKMIHPSAVIGPGTVLTGAATSVGEGSRLLRVVADQSVIGKEVQLTAVRSVSTIVGDKVKLTWAKLGPRVTIGSGTVGAYVGVADDSIIGENNTFEPFALVIGSTTSAGNVIGISLVHSRILPGFMGRHLSTAVHHLDQQPVQFTVGGKRYDLGAASLNVAGGLFIQGVENRSVRLSAAYPLSLTTLRVGTQEVAEVGAFSVLKNQMALDGKVLPLTFHAFNILSSSDPRFAVPGRHNDAIGGALDFPGIFLRNFIYRTKKGIRDDLSAQGLTAEQIAVHPRMLQADYMIEATIIQALRDAMEQLDSVDHEAAQALSPGVEALREAVERDLAQIEMPDQSSLGARGAGDRQEIHRLITRIQDALDPFLESSRPDGVSPSGHTADQLLEGVRRLTLNLDGRWRMRDHTFTEVEWRYVDRENGKALDTWKPVPLAGAAAGLEEIPPEANPLSTVYTPERFAIASPAGSLQGAVYSLNEVNPAQLLADVQAGRRPTLFPKTERVGTALWENVDHRELLQELYGTIYDIRDYAPDFPPARVSRVIELLHHEDQGVAAAARDVIVNARIFGLTEVVRLLAQAYQDRAGSPGPYAAFYFRDAMTTRVDPVHKVEYGSPERNIFSGEMTPERMRRIHDQVKLWVNPKKKLSLFTGSGQRMVAPVPTANAGFKVRRDGLPTGFADPDLVGNDIGSQPHDAVLVVFALVAKLFAENMPKWRQEEGLPMPEHWTVAIGSDGRSTTGAITQVAARIFERLGVKVKMIGITSAPEAAARAYFSDPEENLLATFEITPSHINQAFIGTKLMLWMGQILPWTKAEEFNKLVQAIAQDETKIQEVIQMLQDPEPRNNEELNHRIAEDMLQLPAEYQDSRRRYYEYLKRSWTGNWLGDPASLERDWQALKQSLRERGIVGVLDLNGGARVTDLPLFDDLFDGRYIVMAPDAGSYHHSLPPSRTAARPMIDFLARVTPVFEKAGLTLLAVMPDPDGDRKMMTYRDPVTGEFRYLDPQAGYMLDSMALVMAARELGIPGVGIVSNSAGNPAIRFVLGDRLGAEVRFADVGEANVVQAIANLIGELAQKHGVDLGVDPSLPPQARALEIRKRLASKVSVGGGEPPAAAFIQGVMVRDMAQAFGTMFWFYRKPEWVKGLIEALVDDPQRKADLLRQAEEISRHPAQQQYLMHLLVEQVLPPMWSADPGDKTEKISAVRPEDQRYFKNVMDQMLVQDGVWVARIREEMARIISEEIGQPVSAEQITVSEPVNFNEAFEKQGRGDEARTLPDGRFDPSGGYAVNLSYRSSEGTNYLVGTLWVRGSKTDIGVTRDLPMMTAPFLRPDQAPSFQGRFRDAFHPLWTLFNYAAEAEELRGHVEGRFGGLDLPMLSDLTGNLESTLEAMRLVRNINYSRYGNPEAKDYSEVDAGNLGETDAAARGAAAALQYLSTAISDPLRRGAIPEIDKLLAADFGLTPIGELPSAAREAVAYREAQRQVMVALRWKVQRFLGAPDGEKRLSAVLDDLQAFAVSGAAYANLILDKIVLVKEAEFAQSVGLEEKAGEEAPFEVQVPEKVNELLVVLTPETAEAGIRILNAVRITGSRGVKVAAIVWDQAQARRVSELLTENTRVNLVDIYNLKERGIDLPEALRQIRGGPFEGINRLFVVHTPMDFRALGAELEIPGISVRGWELWLERQLSSNV